jgi:dTDP-4-dehydrorhamnose 3,5-epimerase-like enzyme
MDYKLYTLKNFGDERGSLIPIEEGNNVDFDVRRAFYIYGTTPGTVRGAHANKYSEFLMVVVSGSCKVLVDNGLKKEVINLNQPNQALYLNKMIWKEMYDFSSDAVLLVLSNEKYNENEYIREYEEFIKVIDNR